MSGGFPRGLRLMAAGAFAFSVMSALAKLVGTRVPLMELVLGRSLVVALLAGLALRRQGRVFKAQEPRLLVQRALFGFCALSCYFYSVIHLPLADATVLYFTNPVLTAVAAAIVLKEGMNGRDMAAVLVSLTGVVVIARPGFLFGAGQALDPLAVGAGVAAAVFGAGSYISIRQIQKDPPLLVVFYFASITVLLAAPLVALRAVRPTLTEVLLIVGIGIATHVGQLWVTWGFRLERAGRASSIGYLQIVFAAVWGFVLFQEQPDRWTWLGAGIIIAATFQLVRRHPAR